MVAIPPNTWILFNDKIFSSHRCYNPALSNLTPAKYQFLRNYLTNLIRYSENKSIEYNQMFIECNLWEPFFSVKLAIMEPKVSNSYKNFWNFQSTTNFCCFQHNRVMCYNLEKKRNHFWLTFYNDHLLSKKSPVSKIPHFSPLIFSMS